MFIKPTYPHLQKFPHKTPFGFYPSAIVLLLKNPNDLFFEILENFLSGGSIQ
jgi:hypothetical protein